MRGRGNRTVCIVLCCFIFPSFSTVNCSSYKRSYFREELSFRSIDRIPGMLRRLPPSLKKPVESTAECVPDALPLSDESASSSESDPEPMVPLNERIPDEVGGDKFQEEIPTAQKHVSFGNIEVRKYASILGDHPDCILGPPLTIDWKPFKTKVIPVEDYEAKRGTRRCRNDLHMDWIQRKQYLRKVMGASDEEMRQAACEAQFIRNQRVRTLNLLPFEFIEKPLQSLGRKVKRAVKLGR